MKMKMNGIRFLFKKNNTNLVTFFYRYVVSKQNLHKNLIGNIYKYTHNQTERRLIKLAIAATLYNNNIAIEKKKKKKSKRNSENFNSIIKKIINLRLFLVCLYTF